MFTRPLAGLNVFDARVKAEGSWCVPLHTNDVITVSFIQSQAHVGRGKEG